MNLEDLKSTLRLDEVEDALGLEIVSRSGSEHICYCPLPSHPGRDSNAGNFSFNTDKLVYNCFSCGGGGSLVNLVSEVQSLTYEESLEWLAGFSDYEIFVDDDKFMRELDKIFLPQTTQIIDREPNLPWFPKDMFYEYQCQIGVLHNWLNNRNISDSAIGYFGFGYNPEYHSGGVSYPALIIPHVFKGELRGWQARYMGEEPRPKKTQKYKSSQEFPKEHTLYNYDSILSAETVIVVEAPLTVATLWSYGYPAVATFGASFPDPKKGISRQIKLLQSLNKKLILSFDNDPAGRMAIQRLIDHLDPHTSLDIIPPIEGEKADLGDLSKDQVDWYVDAAIPSFLW